MSDDQAQDQVTGGEAQPADTGAAAPGVLDSTVVRAVLIGLAVIVLLLVVGLIAFFSYRANRNKPLGIKSYPNAQIIEQQPPSGKDYRFRRYLSTDPVESIEQFYEKQDDMSCSRQYSTVIEQPGQETIREGHVFTRCRIDKSWLDITQYVIVTIYPGNTEANPNPENVIDVERDWGS